MTTDRETRKQYWNEAYTAYWRQRVEEAGTPGTSSIVAQDPKTEDLSVYEGVFRRFPPLPGNLLDVGCAWGRTFPLYKALGLRVSGVDISAAMIAEARQASNRDADVDRLEEAEAEALPFADEVFDNLAILAVFDATFQHEALAEIVRVVRPGGRIYLTGKGTRYPKDDRAAIEAEAGARRKGHPNHFTDVDAMQAQLRAAGHRELGTFYFPRRGDFATFTCVEEPPERFYEWFLILERGPEAGSFAPFASDVSETFRGLEAGCESTGE